MHWEVARLSGWGRFAYADMIACTPEASEAAMAAIRQADHRGILARGRGRSYGDVALNSDGRLIRTARLNRILSFDPDTGEIVCEAGVTFWDLNRALLPHGYLAPVIPGTGFVSMGGAVANDVHGKDHGGAGSFGDHLRWMELLLPSGEVIRVSPDQHPHVFAATIGGLGLTGVILAVCFTMRQVASNRVHLHEERAPDLDHLLRACAAVRGQATYWAAWIDALAWRRHLGRGIVSHAEVDTSSAPEAPARRFRLPVDCPAMLLNAYSVRAFNQLYYCRIPPSGRDCRVHFNQFLFPLDAVLEWNRAYGKRGLHQFQCVLPDAETAPGIRRLLETAVQFRPGSFLAVLKALGREGQGLLSFPMPGYTLALDFPHSQGIEALFDRLERIALDHGGRVYLAKDDALSPHAFQAMYPGLDRFRAILDEIDPAMHMNSDMARRLQIRGQRRPWRSYHPNATAGSNGVAQS